jgi:phage-related protein
MRLPNGDSPAKDWVTGLDGKGIGQLGAAFRILENTLRSNRPPAGRAVEIRKPIWELRVTKAGGKPPHHRLFFVRERRTIWVTHGFTKKSNRTPSGEVKRAGRIHSEWSRIRGQE